MSETVYEELDVPGARSSARLASAAWVSAAAAVALGSVTGIVMWLATKPEPLLDVEATIPFESAIVIVPGLLILALNFAYWSSRSRRLAAMPVEARERNIGLRVVALVLVSPIAVAALLLAVAFIGPAVYELVAPLFR